MCKAPKTLGTNKLINVQGTVPWLHQRSRPCTTLYFAQCLANTSVTQRAVAVSHCRINFKDNFVLSASLQREESTLIQVCASSAYRSRFCAVASKIKFYQQIDTRQTQTVQSLFYSKTSIMRPIPDVTLADKPCQFFFFLL